MIEIKNLTKTYDKQTIFNNVSFSFPDNGLVCLLGASGCGKSTLLNMLAGFDSDYSGSITVLNEDISKMDADALCEYRRDNIGFIFQNYNLLSGYTVMENILLSCELSNDSDTDDLKKAKELLTRLDMSGKEKESVQNLSGGQKQRAAIARALIDDPSIILADEPTGALDRKNSTQIMELLKEISKDRLVLVITHDQKICEFADEIVTIQDGNIEGVSADNTDSKLRLKQNSGVKVSAAKRGTKNFKVHMKRYIAVSLAISIGALAFMLSLSSKNIMAKSITDFQEKNTAFNNGYVQAQDNSDKVFKLLKGDARIENIYFQYILENVTLTIGGKNETMKEKYPMPKATESMSYGIMPKMGCNQISLSPSLAKKFTNSINGLIGKVLTLKFNNTEYNLTISGIYNAGYDDFFVSSDIEQELYKKTNVDKPYSVSYDVTQFEDIVAVNQMLLDKKIESKTAVKEVSALQTTFDNLSRLFLIVSILILAIGLFISIILLVKLQNSRYKEVGLLAALGFSKSKIRGMIVIENILLSIMAGAFNGLFIGVTYLISMIFKLDLIVTMPQILLSIFGTGIAVILIGLCASYKLINEEPAVALRK